MSPALPSSTRKAVTSSRVVMAQWVLALTKTAVDPRAVSSTRYRYSDSHPRSRPSFRAFWTYSATSSREMEEMASTLTRRICPSRSSQAVKNRVLNRVSSLMTSPEGRPRMGQVRSAGSNSGKTPSLEAMASARVSMVRAVWSQLKRASSRKITENTVSTDTALIRMNFFRSPAIML